MTKTLKHTHLLRSTIAATTVGMALTLPMQAQAQDITLKSTNDTTINLSGNFVSFENNVYMIETEFGVLKVRGDNVECIGEGCPSVGGVADVDGPVVWNVSLWGSRRAFTEHVEKLAELVETRTEGQLTLNLSYGGLAPSRENLDGIAAGSFEMAQFCAGYHADKNPSITVLELPFLGVTSMEEELAVSQAIYKHPAVVDDMARWNATLLMPTPQPQYNIVGVGSPPVSLESFKSMTVRATGGTGAAVKALGAATVNLPAPQVNEALVNGEINAVAFAPHAHMSFNTIDSAVWWTTNLNPGTANCPIVVNSDALQQLPTSSRIALMTSVDEALDHFVDNYTETTMDAWQETLLERHVIQLQISDDILDAISDEVAGPTAATWIAEKNALGLPAQDLYELVSETLESVR